MCCVNEMEVQGMKPLGMATIYVIRGICIAPRPSVDASAQGLEPCLSPYLLSFALSLQLWLFVSLLA